MRKKIILLATAAFAASSLITAPAASATPRGCGDMANGQLCIKQPAGNHYGGYYTTDYFKHSGKAAKVKLGYRARTPNGKDNGIVWDSKWLNVKAGKPVQKKRYLTMDRGWCIRGYMKSGGKTYQTKYLCWKP
ncbi:hypothetical protein A6A06_25290 [Streptomyces sp. CB02923]|uniref:hypothetical protein n=1 Tax=Streptomyces sp. CB02923 TaxID=1718985 RepID=UPI00093916CD|nr:hypothetical protein [Streptomyces sp. CB02923]OKH98924.1 hypothetical protein A6A06_25290 [Streptomyces sp. CB02923]